MGSQSFSFVPDPLSILSLSFNASKSVPHPSLFWQILLPTVAILLLIAARTQVDTQIHPAQPYIQEGMLAEVGKGKSPNFQQVLELLLAKGEYLAFALDTEETKTMNNLMSMKFPLLKGMGGRMLATVSKKMIRKPRTENEVEDKSYFNFAVWSIWKSRNSYVFNRKNPNPNLPMEIYNQTLEFMYCVASPQNPVRKTRQLKQLTALLLNFGGLGMVLCCVVA